MSFILEGVDEDLDEEVMHLVSDLLDKYHDAKQISQVLVRHATHLALMATDNGHQISAVLIGEFIDVLNNHIVQEFAEKGDDLFEITLIEDETESGEDAEFKRLPKASDIIH